MENTMELYSGYFEDKTTIEDFIVDNSPYVIWLKKKILENTVQLDIIKNAIEEFGNLIPDTYTDEVLPISNLWFYLSEMSQIEYPLYLEIMELMAFCEYEMTRQERQGNRKYFIEKILDLIEQAKTTTE